MNSPHLPRRRLLGWLGASIALPVMAGCGGAPSQARDYPVRFTDAQWKARLSPGAYEVLRHENTETPFTSALLNEHRKGTFCCVADGNPLFSSATKYDSHTGWPSFWQVLPHGAATRVDGGLMGARTEVHCTRCGGHLGHVFDDGPPPTGLRYCMNGVALAFKPA
jgi:peptide-methionine (R)-S-oxide reductase